MVVSGLPRRNGDRHSAEIANMALDLLNEMERFVVKHDPDLHLQLRSGIHIGPCAAGNSEKNAIYFSKTEFHTSFNVNKSRSKYD